MPNCWIGVASILSKWKDHSLQLFQWVTAISILKHIPGPWQGQKSMALEKTDARYGIDRTFKFEKKWLTGSQHVECKIPSGLPEIGIITILASQVGVQSNVSYA